MREYVKLILKKFGDKGLDMSGMNQYACHGNQLNLTTSKLEGAKLVDGEIMIKLEGIETWVTMDAFPDPCKFRVYHAIVLAYREYRYTNNTEYSIEHPTEETINN